MFPEPKTAPNEVLHTYTKHCTDLQRMLKNRGKFTAVQEIAAGVPRKPLFASRGGSGALRRARASPPEETSAFPCRHAIPARQPAWEPRLQSTNKFLSECPPPMQT